MYICIYIYSIYRNGSLFFQANLCYFPGGKEFPFDFLRPQKGRFHVAPELPYASAGALSPSSGIAGSFGKRASSRKGRMSTKRSSQSAAKKDAPKKRMFVLVCINEKALEIQYMICI